MKIDLGQKLYKKYIKNTWWHTVTVKKARDLPTKFMAIIF